jgi:hypothetical protein
MLSVIYAECLVQSLSAECHYAECRFGDCRSAKLKGALLV